MSTDTNSDGGELNPTENNDDGDGDTVAAGVLQDVASLVNTDRDTHGDAVINQEHIAQGWTWYLRGQGVLSPDEELTGGDVSRLMELLKMSRVCVGEYDVDHDIDRAGYAGIAAACEILRDNVDLDEQEVLELDGVTIRFDTDEDDVESHDGE